MNTGLADAARILGAMSKVAMYSRLFNEAALRQDWNEAEALHAASCAAFEAWADMVMECHRKAAANGS